MKTTIFLLFLLGNLTGHLNAQYRLADDPDLSQRVDTVRPGERVQMDSCIVHFNFALVEDTMTYRYYSGQSYFIVPQNAQHGQHILITNILCNTGQEVVWKYVRSYIIE